MPQQLLLVQQLRVFAVATFDLLSVLLVCYRVDTVEDLAEGTTPEFLTKTEHAITNRLLF